MGIELPARALRTDQPAAMVAEMEVHLRAIETRSGGNRQRQLQELFLLALEREELAAVGYGSDELRSRIAELDVDPAIRRVIDHALRWASRDEKGHAVLARSMLVKTGGVVTRSKALLANAGGLVAGWAAAVLHHTSLRRAPFTRAAARIVAVLGRIVGKVPDTAGTALRYQSFRGFCSFQLGAEKTAILSWESIAEVLAGDPSRPQLADAAARIAADERRHEKMLRVLVDAFDEHDRLEDGTTAGTLSAQLAKIHPGFVRTRVRGESGAASHLGCGGVVHVRQDVGLRSGDVDRTAKILRGLLTDVGLFDVMAGLESPKVAIQTTFMMSYDQRDKSPHVDPLLAEQLAVLLHEHGASQVNILESQNPYGDYFEGRSVEQLAAYSGFESPHYRVVDTSLEQVPHTFRRGLAQQTVSRTWRDADLRLVLAKMRTHPSMLVHLTTSSLETLGRPVSEVLFQDREADLAAATVMVADAFPPDVALLDATHDVPDGLTGLLGDPQPCHPGRLYASRDPIALDFVAARHMGIERVPRDSVLAMAVDWFDDPRPLTRVDGPDDRILGLLNPHRNDLTVLLSAMAYTVYVYGGNRGNFWLPLMDSRAFPPRHPPTLLERAVRPLLRTLFGFGTPPSAR